MLRGDEETVKDTGSCLTINGNHLPGIWLTKKFLNLAAERAQIYGTSTVLLKTVIIMVCFSCVYASNC